jgi:hypothetical protein
VNPRHREDHKHCSPRCRKRTFLARKQLQLDWSPPAVLLPPAIDPHLVAEDRLELGGANRLVFERLRQGPATNIELQKLGAGQRPSARCHDVKRWLEPQGFTVKQKRVRRGLHLYWIEDEAG